MDHVNEWTGLSVDAVICAWVKPDDPSGMEKVRVSRVDPQRIELFKIKKKKKKTKKRVFLGNSNHARRL